MSNRSEELLGVLQYAEPLDDFHIALALVRDVLSGSAEQSHAAVTEIRRVLAAQQSIVQAYKSAVIVAAGGGMKFHEALRALTPEQLDPLISSFRTQIAESKTKVRYATA